MPNSIVYFDITIGDAPAGRLTFELFDDIVPKVRDECCISDFGSPQTAANFKHLCIGDKTNDKGVKLAYAGSGFHRCIKG